MFRAAASALRTVAPRAAASATRVFVPRAAVRAVPVGVRTITDAAREWTTDMNKSLEETDPELFDIIEHEKARQRDNVVLIASENFTSRATLDALGSVMQNKYSEGYPNARYYGGNEFIDQAELLCQRRALEAFDLDPEEWGVNVQSLSGSPANFAAYTAVLSPHDRILALDLPHGGHLSHGYQTDKKRISAVSMYFESMPYRLDDNGIIDYDAIPKLAALFRPKLIVAGASAYSRLIDYERFSEIAKSHNAYLLADIAHIAGLMSAKVIPSAFEHCDIVTTTTHKSLRGPRGAMIFYRKGVRSVDKKGNKTMYDLEGKINSAVFPGLQGGPHNHTISALATALKQTQSSTFKTYQTQVMSNCQAFATGLQSRGYDLAAGGTDNHLLLMNLRPTGCDGSRVEATLDLCGLATNKNTIVGDVSALVPSGLRMGTPAMTTRGATEEHFEQIADFVHRGVQIAQGRKAEMEAAGTKKLAAFKQSLAENPPSECEALRQEVAEFSRQFPTVGYNVDGMRY